MCIRDREWTYRAFNEEVNQLAHLLADRGIKRGDTVALFMENRAEYVLSLLALVKLGAAASLINNSLTGAGLVHCIKATEARGCIIGEERLDAFDEVRGELGFRGADDCLCFPDAGERAVPDWAMNAREAMAFMPTHLSLIHI